MYDQKCSPLQEAILKDASCHVLFSCKNIMQPNSPVGVELESPISTSHVAAGRMTRLQEKTTSQDGSLWQTGLCFPRCLPMLTAVRFRFLSPLLQQHLRKLHFIYLNVAYNITSSGILKWSSGTWRYHSFRKSLTTEYLLCQARISYCKPGMYIRIPAKSI